MTGCTQDPAVSDDRVEAVPTDYRPPSRIRVVVVALILHPDRPAIFVGEFADRAGHVQHRPCGGGIEFGETAGEALHREFVEEFDTVVDVGPRLAVWENIFTFNDTPGHEWVVIHEARFRDERYLEDGRWPVRDAPTDVGVWRPLAGVHGIPLYPVGLMTLVRRAPSGAQE